MGGGRERGGCMVWGMEWYERARSMCAWLGVGEVLLAAC
jgi:hypothetical protein